MSTSVDHHEPLRELLMQRPEVMTAWLFGSAVEDGDKPADLDVAVVFGDDNEGLAMPLALQAFVEASLDVPVDLHEFDRLPVDLRYRIVQRGVVLVDREPAARLHTEIETLKAYNDFRPYLERIRAGARKRLTTGVDGG